MKIEKRTLEVFVANDGTEFDNEDDCHFYEVERLAVPIDDIHYCGFEFDIFRCGSSMDYDNTKTLWKEAYGYAWDEKFAAIKWDKPHTFLWNNKGEVYEIEPSEYYTFLRFRYDENRSLDKN